jgi:hypothetical protein
MPSPQQKGDNVNIQSMVTEAQSLPTDLQDKLARKIYHAADVRSALSGKPPMPRTADGTIDWQALFAALLADAPEILALIESLLGGL